MKVKTLLAVGFAAAAQAAQIVKGGHGSQEADGTISKVVKMLEDMLAKSKEDGEKEKELFDKFKCYCDEQKEEKETTIKDLTKESGLLESQIEGLQGSTGDLSSQCAKLRKDMDENEQARTTAEEIRKKENEAFLKEEADLTASIGMLGEAISTLAEVGADQTMGASAEHEQMMAGFGEEGGSLLKLKTRVKQALLAANAFLKPAQKSKVSAFLQKKQAPGAYSAQSGEIVGILSGMKDTFQSNLETAQATEKQALETHTKFMETKTEEYDTMKSEYDTKQETLSGNDGDLSTAQEQLTTAKEGLADANKFLELLEPQCVDKTKDFEKRDELRVNEQAALAKAVAILSSDLASSSFGKVGATTGFLQLRATHRHVQIAAKQAPSTRVQIQKMLLKAAKSGRVRRVAVMLQAGNPFDTVLSEIEKMIKLIDKEAENDKKQFDWCKSEVEKNEANLEEKKEKITTIEGRIDELVDSIDNPETGLKQQIIETEESLQENSKSQKDETVQRRDEHAAYTTTVSDIVRAEALLQKAVTVLKDYYTNLAKEASSDDDDSLLQKSKKKKKEEPSAPETWEGDFTGQSEQGNEAISMIEFIIEETKKEEDGEHESESTAQKAFEESMIGLKEEQESLEKQLVDTKKNLAEAELELEGKREELDVTTKEKVALERYLEKISPGCGFITDNFDTRESNRAEEKKALENAVSLLEGSPSYKAASIAAEDAAMGECKDRCYEHGKDNAICKACLASVSVPGYCAGHPDTAGC